MCTLLTSSIIRFLRLLLTGIRLLVFLLRTSSTVLHLLDFRPLIVVTLLLLRKRFLDQANQLAQATEQEREPKAPSLDAASVDEEVHERVVAADEDTEVAKVWPLVASADVEC